MAETMLRVANIGSEEELVRDALDQIGALYEHVDSEPENSYPQTAYLQISSNVSENLDYLLAQLSEEHGFEAEIL
jgi:Mor family transcriptional regulator